MHRLLRRLLIACLLLVTAVAQAGRIAEQDFDDRIRLADTELLLNGLGVRQVAWLKGYAAGMYLGRKVRTAPEALAQPGPKRIQMKMLIDVDAQELVKAFDKGMRRNHTPAEHAALKPRIDSFDRTVLAIGALKKGDVIDLDLLPATGVVIRRNGAPQGTPIPGDDLYAGLMKIFIGDDPVDKSLKAGLLGGP